MEYTDKELDEIAEAIIRHAHGGDDSIDTTTLAADFAVLYRVCGFAVPTEGLRIEIADGPLAASDAAGGGACSQVGIGTTVWWVRSLMLFRDALPDDAPGVLGLEALDRICRAGVYDSVWCVEGVIVVRRPCAVHVDERGELHAIGRPAIRWRNGEEVYAEHGVVVPRRLYMTPATAPRHEWAAANTEVVRVCAARWGWGQYLAHMGGTLVDAATIGGLVYELYDIAGGRWRLLRKQSPPLQDGTQPWYVEPVPVECRTAAGARRWQVPTADGEILSSERAEELAEALRYVWEA